MSGVSEWGSDRVCEEVGERVSVCVHVHYPSEKNVVYISAMVPVTAAAQYQCM